jgi:hypothetical protein
VKVVVDATALGSDGARHDSIEQRLIDELDSRRRGSIRHGG